MLNYNTKRINPKFLLLIILFIACILTFKNYINFTYCLQYQIAECPDGLSLSTYGVEAETDDEAIQKVKDILNNNNFNSDDYIITIKDNFIKITADTIEETQETINNEDEIPENIIVEENPENGIMLLLDYIAEKEYTLKDGTKIYLNEETKNAYKYIFIMNSNSARAIFLFNNYEITKYASDKRPQNIKLIEAIRLNPIGGIGILEENTTYSGTIYEELEITGFTKTTSISNFDLFYSTGEIYLESKFVEEPTNPETPTDPEEPTDPETPEDTTTIDLTEVITNLEKIQKINMCIVIMLAIMFIYTFTNTLLGRRK